MPTDKCRLKRLETYVTLPGTRDVIAPVAEEVAALPSAEIIPYTADCWDDDDLYKWLFMC